MRNWQIFIRAHENLKIGTFIGSFYTKQKMYEIKTYWGVMCYNNEGWWKIWKGINLPVQNCHEEFSKFWHKHSKISKIYTLVGCFGQKYIMLELRKYRRVMFDGIQVWYKIWRKTNLCFQKSHKEFGKFHQSPWKPQSWDLDDILLSKVENVWASNLQGSYVSWQWRIIQKLKKNLLVSSKLTWGIWRILTWALENLKKISL